MKLYRLYIDHIFMVLSVLRGPCIGDKLWIKVAQRGDLGHRNKPWIKVGQRVD